MRGADSDGSCVGHDRRRSLRGRPPGCRSCNARSRAWWWFPRRVPTWRFRSSRPIRGCRCRIRKASVTQVVVDGDISGRARPLSQLPRPSECRRVGQGRYPLPRHASDRGSRADGCSPLRRRSGLRFDRPKRQPHLHQQGLRRLDDRQREGQTAPQRGRLRRYSQRHVRIGRSQRRRLGRRRRPAVERGRWTCGVDRFGRHQPRPRSAARSTSASPARATVKARTGRGQRTPHRLDRRLRAIVRFPAASPQSLQRPDRRIGRTSP